MEKIKSSLPISSSTATLVASENEDVSNLNNSNSLKVVRKQTSALVTASAKASIKDSESKKREDLTSLGSDDSGEFEEKNNNKIN